MKAWWKLLQITLEAILEIIRNPSFIMFSIIALGLGTMGIWISFFSLGFEDSDLVKQIDNLSVFTFCIATLGGIAADYFFEEKSKESSSVVSDDELKKELGRHAVFFLWSSSALITFYSLNNDEGIYMALVSTFLLWGVVNIKKPKFQKIDEMALNNLAPQLNENKNAESNIGGKGL